MLDEWRRWRASHSKLKRPWQMPSGTALHLSLDHCYISIYNRMGVGKPDPKGNTSIIIETKPGYVLEPPMLGLMNWITHMTTHVKDQRDATDASRMPLPRPPGPQA